MLFPASIQRERQVRNNYIIIISFIRKEKNKEEPKNTHIRELGWILSPYVHFSAGLSDVRDVQVALKSKMI